MTTIQETASQILDVGQRRFWADDYEKRMDTFADVVEGLDPAARAQLFDEILEQDSGATMSWLTVDRLDSLAREGRITANDAARVLKGLVTPMSPARSASRTRWRSPTSSAGGRSAASA